MTTLDKIKAEIEQIEPYDLPWDKRTPEHIKDMALDIIDKYAAQETDIEYIGEFCHTHGLVLMSKEMADKYAGQEPCDDVVSRQAVINIVKLRWDYYKNCIEAIEKLPSVRPQEPKWIPVSERLPEKDDLYLICFDDGEYDLVYFCKGAFSYSGVIAWIPLPKPYEPQERSDKE